MKTNKDQFRELDIKIQEGLKKAYQKLVEKKAKENGSLILSVNGKVTEVQAAEILKTLKK